ncbi:hypothetical protein K461DRAFT_53369 [Myriangium duriaei CBS 260.36]|uniref:Uncharacterized protein n=1 Tax=Myriangium duriaei CBS 260.36 TaxID=1168546 RepID=A0A9P4MCJ9_9PEZI|nr:hypothetical protein K461DRAFT_53369 [Myriangium duriaei CBS 260.36]
MIVSDWFGYTVIGLHSDRSCMLTQVLTVSSTPGAFLYMRIVTHKKSCNCCSCGDSTNDKIVRGRANTFTGAGIFGKIRRGAPPPPPLHYLISSVILLRKCHASWTPRYVAASTFQLLLSRSWLTVLIAPPTVGRLIHLLQSIMQQSSAVLVQSSLRSCDLPEDRQSLCLNITC